MPDCIEYCIANVDAGTRRRLADRPATREKPCLQRCGECAAGAVLVVDGELARGGDHAALLREVAE